MCYVAQFFFNDTAATEIYTLSLHDALPIWVGPALLGLAAQRLVVEVLQQRVQQPRVVALVVDDARPLGGEGHLVGDRKSTRLNSSHANISYAVFCLKKKTQTHRFATVVHSL